MQDLMKKNNGDGDAAVMGRLKAAEFDMSIVKLLLEVGSPTTTSSSTDRCSYVAASCVCNVTLHGLAQSFVILV